MNILRSIVLKNALTVCPKSGYVNTSKNTTASTHFKYILKYHFRSIVLKNALARRFGVRTNSMSKKWLR